MSYSPPLSSGFTFAENRSAFISPQSGMCSFCTEKCGGTCELAQAAVLGSQTVYPMTTGTNQIASEKDYPIDFSHFNTYARLPLWTEESLLTLIFYLQILKNSPSQEFQVGW